MDKYLQALSNYSEEEELEWLIHYFDLYKNTLTWPDDLPPLVRIGMSKFKKSFHGFYKEHLDKYEYEFVNYKRKLKVKSNANNNQK
jgi:hypothetical protein